MAVDSRYYTINERLLSPMSYNFFGDIDITLAFGKCNFEEARECIQEVYDRKTWNIQQPNIPPMYKQEAEQEDF